MAAQGAGAADPVSARGRDDLGKAPPPSGEPLAAGHLRSRL